MTSAQSASAPTPRLIRRQAAASAFLKAARSPSATAPPTQPSKRARLVALAATVNKSPSRIVSSVESN